VVRLALADQVSDRRVGTAPRRRRRGRSRRGRDQLLGHDALQRDRQLDADLALLVAGKTSMMRSIVCAASWCVQRANTRWPVSAAVSAVEIV